MDLQDRYDELDNIETTLRMLITEIDDKEYIQIFEELMFKAQEEKEDLEPRLQAIYDAEEKQQEKEYWDSQF